MQYSACAGRLSVLRSTEMKTLFNFQFEQKVRLTCNKCPSTNRIYGRQFGHSQTPFRHRSHIERAKINHDSVTSILGFRIVASMINQFCFCVTEIHRSEMSITVERKRKRERARERERERKVEEEKANKTVNRKFCPNVSFSFNLIGF